MGTVSVLVNAYNYGRFVAEAVESALAQTVAPLEVIVVDDGSTDGTARVLDERFGGQAAVKVVLQRNQGQLAAMVRGMEQAEGDLICFLDADDSYEPNHLENVTGAFAAHPDVDFAFTAHRRTGDQEGVIQYAPEDANLGFSLIAAWKGRCYVGSIASTMAMRRSLSQALLPALRQVAPRWRMRADDCLVFGASMAGAKKRYLAEPTVLYRIHSRSYHLKLEPEPIEELYAHGLRRDTFFEVLGAHLGLGPSVRLRVAWEFLSIERPTREQYRTYLGLNRELRETFLEGLKGRAKMYLHYRRNRAAWDA